MNYLKSPDGLFFFKSAVVSGRATLSEDGSKNLHQDIKQIRFGSLPSHAKLRPHGIGQKAPYDDDGRYAFRATHNDVLALNTLHIDVLSRFNWSVN
jgi:hypothetical protein